MHEALVKVMVAKFSNERNLWGGLIRSYLCGTEVIYFLLSTQGSLVSGRD